VKLGGHVCVVPLQEKRKTGIRLAVGVCRKALAGRHSVLWAQGSDGDDEVLGFAETGGWYAFVLLVG
jgi:hypothetical protein